jgi:hypothetical protein
LQPFAQASEQQAQQERDSILNTAITDTAQSLGGLRGGDAAVARVAASVRSQFMPEAARVYGNTDRAAQVAIDRAIRAELAYQNEIAGTATEQSAGASRHARGRSRRAVGVRRRRSRHDAARQAAVDRGTRREVRLDRERRTPLDAAPHRGSANRGSHHPHGLAATRRPTLA